MTKENIINETIKQIEYTNKTIALINFYYEIKDKSIEVINTTINSLNYNECIHLFATWEGIPDVVMNMLTHDEILTRISKCQNLPRLVRKVMYERLEIMHKLTKE